MKRIKINDKEIEVPEGYEVVVKENGEVKIVPREEEEDWEKIRKEFDRIDPKDMIPVQGSGFLKGVFDELGYKASSRQVGEMQKEFLKNLRIGGIVWFLLFFIPSVPFYVKAVEYLFRGMWEEAGGHFIGGFFITIWGLIGLLFAISAKNLKETFFGD